MVGHRVGRKAVHIVVVAVHKQVAAAVPTGFAVRKAAGEAAVRKAAASGAGSTGLVVLVLTAETVGMATEDTGTEAAGLVVVGEVCYTPTALEDTVKTRHNLEEVVV